MIGTKSKFRIGTIIILCIVASIKESDLVYPKDNLYILNSKSLVKNIARVQNCPDVTILISLFRCASISRIYCGRSVSE